MPNYVEITPTNPQLAGAFVLYIEQRLWDNVCRSSHIGTDMSSLTSNHAQVLHGWADNEHGDPDSERATLGRAIANLITVGNGVQVRVKTRTAGTFWDAVAQ